LKKIFFTAFILVLLDQILKIWIKTHFTLEDGFQIYDWFKIYFIENPGMAFGWEIPHKYGKPALTLFRIIVVVIGIFYVKSIVKLSMPKGALIGLGLIIGGAIGNIIDSSFYGIVFNESSKTTIASFMPESGGYSSLLHGKVVDMFYFPLIDGDFPNWLPIWGGEPFIFFSPVFNIADAGISIGIFMILLFYRKEFN
jgi:signal peptidase II